MANSRNTIGYGNTPGFLTSAEKTSPLGYYFAFLIIFLVGGIYALVEFGGIVTEKAILLVTISDALLVVGTIMFLATSLFGYIKSKNLRIQDAMFGFSMASLSFCVAGFIWTWYNLVLQVRAPFPSMADVFFLIGSLATIAAIYSATRAVTETTGLKVELNVIIIVLAVIATAAIVWTYASYTDILKGGLTPSAFISIAYPALDIICLALVGNLILTSIGRSVFESQLVIAIGSIILSISHIYFSVTTSMGFYRYEPLAITLYAVSYMLYAIGISRYVDLTKYDLIMDRIQKLNKVQ
ncbi:MAG TPA: hypothetical protein VMC84_08670 [Methanocella sp.]|uniref:hypothetical protein n=1 Tax=Methanocella sp. TaxID=2052833 RepID=UPI002C74E3B6|nr:hypothetical protein [Methanocella sp.]HTY91234.1 hypothetical protein [Methanocella sp.]